MEDTQDQVQETQQDVVEPQAQAPVDETEGFEVTTSDQVGANEEQEEQGKASDNQAPQDEAQAKNDTEKQPRRSRAQRRIDAIVAERENVKQENERLKKELESLKKPKEQQAEKQESDFDTYGEYLDYLEGLEISEDEAPQEPKQDDKKQDQVDESELSEEEQLERARAQLTHEQKVAIAQVTEQFEIAEDMPGDFIETISNKAVPLTADVIMALSQCDNPAKVAYHLGKNLEVARDIASSPVGDQITAIVNLEKTLMSGSNSSQETPKPKPKVSNAPEPINPLGGTHDATPRPLNEVSFQEYEARMNAREASDGGGW